MASIQRRRPVLGRFDRVERMQEQLRMFHHRKGLGLKNLGCKRSVHVAV